MIAFYVSMRSLLMSAATNSLSVQLLGPLRVWSHNEELIIGPPKQKALLALLATHHGSVVRREQIVDGLWGPEAPSTAVNGVHTYIAGLRRVLDPVRGSRESGEVLVSRLGGYELQLPVDAVDAALFVRQREEARRMAAAGRSEDAFERLGMALGLWHGDALAGVPGPFAAMERSRLREMRFTDVEEWIGGMIAAGRSEEAIVVLNEAIVQEPLREKLRYLLMLALYWCGRQAHALHVYSDTRSYLDEELGIGPGAELRDLHARILTGTVEGEAPARVSPPESAPPRGSEPGDLPASPDFMPSHLPSRARVFVGRCAELRSVRAMLTQDTPERGRATPILAIDGAPGVGKSALALELAHESLDRFPDGQLYVDLSGTSDSPLSAFDALAQLLQSLGIEQASLPADLDGRVMLYRSLLHGRRMLVVLDNALDVDQLRPLIPQGSACLIVTSRQPQRGLAVRYGAHRIRLKPLDPETAVDLLLRLTGAEHGPERPSAIDRLVEQCGYLPLAVRITAGTLLGDPYGSPERLAAQYEDPAMRLDLLQIDGDEEISVREAFAASYRNLSDEAARLLRLLCMTDSEVVGLLSSLRLMGSSVAAVTECLELLVDHGLLERIGPERYELNGLVRIYGAERAEAQPEAIPLHTPRQLMLAQGEKGRRIGGRAR
ncbi:BTAD domain-containing putative transcriptional regulator [Streptomyces flavidovirens]|uniref:AfsR/SARP family transcriptional regulator n=1 Tax=Streptomyces flavidovirens TaxID=67298 RepID=UPI00343B9DDD